MHSYFDMIVTMYMDNREHLNFRPRSWLRKQEVTNFYPLAVQTTDGVQEISYWAYDNIPQPDVSTIPNLTYEELFVELEDESAICFTAEIYVVSADGNVTADRRISLAKPMTNFELEDAVKKLRIECFRGVYLRDTLPRVPRANECGIMNLDDSRRPGRHWVAWIKRGNTKIYFDSYWLSPPDEIVIYLKKPLYYRTDPVQTKDVICGALCLFVLSRLNHVSELSLLPKFQNAINNTVQQKHNNFE